MLDQISAVVRPRLDWEGADLGLALARRHFWQIWFQWLLLIMPFWVLLAIPLWNHPTWYYLLIWWLKPVFARLPLFTISRALFGQNTGLRQVLKNWTMLLPSKNLYFLTLGRLSPWRAMNMPIRVLEGSAGGQANKLYTRRASALTQHGSGVAFWGIKLFLLLELFITFALLAVVVKYLPNFFEFSHLDSTSSFKSFLTTMEDSRVEWLMTGFWLLAVSVVEIFHVGMGFGLYINSRSHLEGWDVEINFRKLATRLQSLRAPASVSLLVLGLCLVASLTAQAETPRQSVEEVLRHPDFIVHEEEYYEKVKVPGSSGSSSGSGSGSSGCSSSGGGTTGCSSSTPTTPSPTTPSPTTPSAPLPPNAGMDLEALGRVLFWGIIAALVGLLGYLLYANRAWFKRQKQVSSDAEASLFTPAPLTVLGMEVTREKLPPNLLESARIKWQQGDTHGALRLLYAGSLCWMIDTRQMPVRESDTEGDCLRHMANEADPNVRQYFENLTRNWISSAYGKRNPEECQMAPLLDAWPFGEMKPVG
jgi:hypothetical protein